jgi:hypothetical protein
MAEITARKHWPFNNRSGAVTMVTPLLSNSNMILLSLHSVPKHLTPATTLISVEKAAMCRAHERCLIIIYLLTAIGLSPGGSGYFTCTQIWKEQKTN